VEVQGGKVEVGGNVHKACAFLRVCWRIGKGVSFGRSVDWMESVELDGRSGRGAEDKDTAAGNGGNIEEEGKGGRKGRGKPNGGSGSAGSGWVRGFLLRRDTFRGYIFVFVMVFLRGRAILWRGVELLIRWRTGCDGRAPRAGY